MTSREEFLRRVRDGLMALPDDERTVTVSHRYPRQTPAVSTEDRATLVESFASRLKSLGAEVDRITEPEIADRVNLVLRVHGATAVTAPDGLPGEWLEYWSETDGHHVVPDHPHSSTADPVDAIVTTCTGAVADSGTLVLDGRPGQLRRTPSRVPGCHVCVVRADQIVASLPEVLDRLDPRRPITFFGGPSAAAATPDASDPRQLIVFIVE
ncbi:LutC/YkgG family protein [Nocardia wallacei]|uniref:LutC/YkgG family protein n=1 Tax=Nocardia wallacei TaxID=480035 RepID=UPI002458A8FC|nr:LUD domain-containing protein [Nocardia wallacei]